MSDRLPALLQQRASLHEQLAQLDRQIALELSTEIARARPLAAPLKTASPFPAQIPAVAAAFTDPDAVLQHYAGEPKRAAADTRRGCLVYAAVALAILIGGAALLLRFYRH